MRLVTAEQMQALDQNAIRRLKIPGALLMENAGRAAAQAILNVYAPLYPGPVMVVAGSGNNGGDGYVVARILVDAGWQVRVVILADRLKIQGDASLMLEILTQLEPDIHFVAEASDLAATLMAQPPRLIVDALLGTGLSKPVSGVYATAIQTMNQLSAPVVALDIPSGVNGTDGRIMGEAVKADLTLSFDSAKVGQLSRPGAECVGSLQVLDIGIPQLFRPPLLPNYQALDEQELAALLPHRSASGHKGSFGHLGVIAGSAGMTGAAALCSEAGLRSGAGLVTLACAGGIHDILEVKLTEVMTRPLVGEHQQLCSADIGPLRAFSAERQALVVGPGLGQSPPVAEAIRGVIAGTACPMVIDADGLNALVGHLEQLAGLASSQVVLTPHPGEFSRLTGLTIAEIEADRLRLCCKFAATHGVVLLLKGAKTLIAASNGDARINTSGNDGLATAGSGDVLTGIIGGLLAQGLNAFDAASLGAWLHGAAADRIAARQGRAGMLASDLLTVIPNLRSQLEGDTYADR